VEFVDDRIVTTAEKIPVCDDPVDNKYCGKEELAYLVEVDCS